MAKTRDAVVVKPRNDAYTGLLAISFLALVGATVLMALDADALGKPPAKLQINVPGTTPGKAGEGLSRPAIGGGPAAGPGGKGAGRRDRARAEPKELPPLPALAAADAPATVVPVKAESKSRPGRPAAATAVVRPADVSGAGRLKHERPAPKGAGRCHSRPNPIYHARPQRQRQPAARACAQPLLALRAAVGVALRSSLSFDDVLDGRGQVFLRVDPLGTTVLRKPFSPAGLLGDGTAKPAASDSFREHHALSWSITSSGWRSAVTTT